MKISNNKFHIISAVLFLLLMPVEQTHARYEYEALYFPQNIVQRNEDIRQFELSASQARSRVGHTLVNYFLGKTMNQFLDFGTADAANRKNFKGLKLRLNRRRAILVYQYNFY